MMHTVHAAIGRWFMLLVLIWLTSCSQSRSAVRPQPILSPNFSQAVDEAIQSMPQPANIWPETLPGVSSLVHEVKWPRETLFSIALWYTGSGKNWKRLAEANPQIKPKKIHIGQTVLIPEDLLKTRRPMPAGVLKPSPPGKSNPPQKRSAPQPQAERITLYGPIENDAPKAIIEEKGLPVPLEKLE